jgi:hypothetical protein
MHHLTTLLALFVATIILTGCADSDPPSEGSSATTSIDRATDVPKAAATANDQPGANSRTAPADEPDEQAGETTPASTDSTDATVQPSTVDVAADSPIEPEPTQLPDDLFKDSDVQPLNENNTVLLDVAGKRLLLKTSVSLTLGQLEMLLCLKQTKEHESILTIDAKAFTIHTGLLALGCEEGTPYRYDSEKETLHAPQGQIIDVFLHWVDTDGKLHREPAQSWVRRARYRYYEEPFESLPTGLTLAPDGDLRYDEMNKVVFWYGPMSEQQRNEHLKLSDDARFRKAIERFFKESQSRPMKDHWLFVGSGFFDDEELGRQYLAEGGYVICLANFAMALLDVSSESSAGTDSLTYEAWTERIPPRESEVLVELVPRPAKKTEATDNQPKTSEESP